MIESRTGSGRICNRAMSGLLTMAGIFCLLMAASCNSERVSQAEARAAQAENKATELSAKLDQIQAAAAADKRLVDELHGKVKAIEDRAKAAPAIAAIDKIQATMAQGAAAKPRAPAAKLAVAAKEPKELPDAILVHSLDEKDEGAIAKEYAEMTPALAACDKDGKLGLALCVMPKQGEYSTWLRVLVTWNTSAVTTGPEVKSIRGCLLQQGPVKSAVRKTETNAVDLVARLSFKGECLPKPTE